MKTRASMRCLAARGLVTGLATALLTGLVFGLAPSAASAETVEWVLETAPGSNGEGWLSQPCGSYGVFRFCDATSSPCTPPGGGRPRRDTALARGLGSSVLASGLEKEPRIYPGPPGSSAGKAAPAPMPCAEGSCFVKLEQIEDPWVAVVDWNRPHGWSVGWTVGHASSKSLSQGPGVELGLFRLDEERFSPFARRGVTDVQVIASLCEIAEWVEVGRPGTIPPPRVVNLSLGRFAATEDGETCVDPSSSRLSCQLRQVIGHLEERIGGSQGPRPRVVAAAGNFRALMFPAVDSRVEAVEAFDLERFALQGLVEPSWESPASAGSAAFLPGAGLCLREPEGASGWPAPAGSSYSAALFSGWLATALAHGWVSEEDEGVVWRPSYRCDTSGCHFEMKGESPAQVTEGLEETLLRIVTLTGRCVEATGLPGIDLRVPLEPVTDGDEIPRVSFLERVDGVWVPSPEPNPCVPCEGAPRPPRQRSARGPGVAPVFAPAPVPKDLKLGLSASAPLPAGANLVGLLLRVGEKYYRPAAPLDYGAIAGGGVRTLILEGASSLLAGSKQQSSLLFVFEAPEVGQYWSSTPLWLAN